MNLITLSTALNFAAEKHKHQLRKDGITPYINHPLEVFNILVQADIQESDVLIAALLHDTLEDTQTTEAEIAEHFGQDVLQIVKEVTDEKSLPKEERKAKQIEHASDLSKQAKMVKIADKTANLKSMSTMPPVDWPLERVRNYFDWSAQVVDNLRGIHPALEARFDNMLSRKP